MTDFKHTKAFKNLEDAFEGFCKKKDFENVEDISHLSVLEKLKLDLKKMSTAKSEYYVYVINLKKDVLNIKKFKDKNPDYIEGKPCVYVGQVSS